MGGGKVYAETGMTMDTQLLTFLCTELPLHDKEKKPFFGG